jgi:hypothetical protein
MTFGNLLGHQGASKIIGNFAGYVIARGMTENGNTFSGGSSVENLTIVNTHASGGGIRLGCGIGVTIRNCNVIANFAINLLNQDEPVGGEGGGAYYGSFEVCVIDCDLRPHDPATVGFTSSNVPASFGLARPSDGPTTNCSFIGFDVAAMTMGGEGAMPFRGCYFEGNNYAMGNAWGPGHPQGSAGTPVGGVQCLGCYFKNNGVAILATSAGGPYKGCAIEATEGTLAGGGNPQYGIYVPSGGHNIFQGFKITGQYQQAGVAILGNSGDACHMEGITVSNTSTLGGVKWILPPNATQAHFLACNVAPVYLFGNLSTTNYVVSTATWDSGTGLATVNVVPGLGDLPNRGTDGNSNAYITGVSVSGYNGLFSDVSTGLFSIVFPLANPGGSGSGGNMFFIVDSAVTQEGNCYDIRDGNTATWGAAVDSGGSNHVKVRFNPTGWTVVGK